MRFLDPNRYVSKILLSDVGPFLDLAHSYGLNAETQDFPCFSKRRPWIYLRSVHRLIRIIKAERIDLVHMNCVHTLLYAAPICRWLKIPYVFHVRDARQPWFKLPALKMLNQSHAVIANSAFIANICHEKGVSPTLLKTVYNPIEIGKFSGVNAGTGRRLRDSLQIPSTALVFGFVGRLHAIKGPDLFIQAAAVVLERFPDTYFVIAGEAHNQEYVCELQNLLVSEALASKVHFLGFFLDVPALMSAFDILVMPSRDEPFGRVAVEAMASGCPVIVSRTGGLVEIVTDGQDGLIVPSDDVTALAAAMIRLAKDTELRSRLSQNGLSVAQRYAPEHHAEEIQRIYDEILRG